MYVAMARATFLEVRELKHLSNWNNEYLPSNHIQWYTEYKTKCYIENKLLDTNITTISVEDVLLVRSLYLM